MQNLPYFANYLFACRFRDDGGDGGDGGGGDGVGADGGDSGVGSGGEGDSGDTGGMDSGIGFGGGTMGALGLDGAMDSASSPESNSTIGDTSQADVASFAQMDAAVNPNDVAAALAAAPNAPSSLGLAASIASIFGGLLGLIGAPVAGTMASIAGRGMSIADSLGVQGIGNPNGAIGVSAGSGDSISAGQKGQRFILVRPVLTRTVFQNGSVSDADFLSAYLAGLQMSDAQDKQTVAPNVPAQQAITAGGSTTVSATTKTDIPMPVMLAVAAAVLWFVFKGKD